MDVLPPTNLPGPSEFWARDVEARLREIERRAVALGVDVESLDAFYAAVKGSLGRQVEYAAAKAQWASDRFNGPSPSIPVGSWWSSPIQISRFQAATGLVQVEITLQGEANGRIGFTAYDADYPTSVFMDRAGRDAGGPITKMENPVAMTSGVFRTRRSAIWRLNVPKGVFLEIRPEVQAITNPDTGGNEGPFVVDWCAISVRNLDN